MAEPITLDEAKAHLRYVASDQDAAISSAIVDARAWVEDYTGLALTPRSVTEIYDGFGGDIRLSAWPVRSVTALSYIDAGGISQALDPAAYRLVAARRPGRLVVSTGRWPATRCRIPDAVTVTIAVGYASPADIPPALIRAVKLMVGYYFNNRSAEDGSADAEAVARRQCRRYRVKRL